MTTIDGLASALNQLDDMEAMFALHHIRDFAVPEVKSDILEFGDIHTFAGKAEFAALAG